MLYFTEEVIPEGLVTALDLEEFVASLIKCL